MSYSKLRRVNNSETITRTITVTDGTHLGWEFIVLVQDVKIKQIHYPVNDLLFDVTHHDLTFVFRTKEEALVCAKVKTQGSKDLGFEEISDNAV